LIEQCDAAKSLDGHYVMMGEDEKIIRQHPAGTGSAVLQKEFAALRC
jgi:hypothetical protein